MNRLHLLAALGWLGASQTAIAAPEASEHELHTAQCVAALETNTEDLAAQVKAGRADLQPELLSRLKYGAAFIGDAYLQGERDEAHAQALLKAALAAQKALSAAELFARQSECATEGGHLLAKADFLSRALVSHLAQRRMKKLLEG